MYQYCFISFPPPPPPPFSLSAVDLICRHIAAIVNRHWVNSACCFLPINKAIDPHCCHQFRLKRTRKDESQPTSDTTSVHLYISHTYTHTPVACDWYDLYEPHMYNKTSCLTVAVVVVLHYFTFDERLNNLFSFYFLILLRHLWRFYVLFLVFVNVDFLFYELWQCYDDVYILPIHWAL